MMLPIKPSAREIALACVLAALPAGPQCLCPARDAATDRRLTEVVRIVVSVDSDRNFVFFSDRISAIARLSDRLSATDVAALLEFAFAPRPGTIQPREWHAVVNDILDRLLAQKSPVPGLIPALCDSARTQSDPVLRDYSIQKLGNRLRTAPDSLAAQEILPVLKELAATPGADWQGTAILAWQRSLSDRGSLRHDAEFAKTAADCLNSPSATAAARLSALQAAASAGLPAAAAFARSRLADSSSPVAMKLSCLAALGSSGNESDLPLLNSLCDDPACGPAATAALRSLSER